jgi:hypothetical protein
MLANQFLEREFECGAVMRRSSGGVVVLQLLLYSIPPMYFDAAVVLASLLCRSA